MFFKKRNLEKASELCNAKYQLVLDAIAYDIYKTQQIKQDNTPLPFDVFRLEPGEYKEYAKSVLVQFPSLLNISVWVSVEGRELTDSDFRDKLFFKPKII